MREEIKEMIEAQKIRMVVFPTIFGILWGLIEMFVGSYLHMIEFPFTGAVLAGVGAIILCLERSYTPYFRACIYTGIVAVIFKFLSIGVIKVSPAIGIMIETLIAEAILTALGPNPASYFITCCACSLEGVPHFFISSWVRYGLGIFDAYRKILEKLGEIFHMGENPLLMFILIWVGLHLVIGIISGILVILIAGLHRKKEI